MTSDKGELHTQNWEQLEKIKAAVNTQFKTNVISKKNKRKNKKKQILDAVNPVNLLSLRKNIFEEDDSYNLFKVSDEFEKEASEQLAKRLEKDLNELVAENVTAEKSKKKVKGCVRLLKCSETYLKVYKNGEKCLKNPKRHFLEVDDDLEERCREVAVSSNDIMEKRDVQFWSNRSKAEIFKYKTNVNGKLVEAC